METVILMQSHRKKKEKIFQPTGYLVASTSQCAAGLDLYKSIPLAPVHLLVHQDKVNFLQILSVEFFSSHTTAQGYSVPDARFGIYIWRIS